MARFSFPASRQSRVPVEFDDVAAQNTTLWLCIAQPLSGYQSADKNFSLHSDAFQRREKAQEDYAIRKREKEKLVELKKKLAEQQVHLQQLSDHM